MRLRQEETEENRRQEETEEGLEQIYYMMFCELMNIVDLLEKNSEMPTS